METKIVVPALGESIVEATVARWFKKVGDPVSLGEPLVELETDKVNLEVGAEQAGVLSSIERGEQEDVKVGEVLGVITPAGGDQPAPAAPAKPAEKPAQTEQAAPPEQAPDEAAPRKGEAAPSEREQPATEAPAPSGERVSPLAAKIAQEHGIDLSQVTGTGPGGRVLRQDVEAVALKQAGGGPPMPQGGSDARQAAPQPQTAPAPTQSQRPPTEAAPSRPAAAPPQPASPPTQASSAPARSEERVRLSRRRRTIAQRLVEAQHNAAMLTTFNDADMTAVMDIRAARKQAFKDKFGASLGIVSFFVKASILALQDFPQINAEIQGDEMVLKHYYDIGIAIGDEEGLVVPVVRDADRLSFGQIEQDIQGFAEKAKQGSLSVEDLRGGTFTITNGGVYGSMLSTPILNPPQVAILGLHRIEQRPVARDGQVVIRPMMYLALSYDHRIVDGREAVQFLARIKSAIENPELMMLGL